MRDKLLSWLPSGKDVVANILANAALLVPGMMITVLSGLAAFIASPQSDEAWVKWFLIALMALSATWALIALGRRWWVQAAATTLRPAPPDPIITDAATDETTAVVGKKPSVDFFIEGDWLNTPFRLATMGMNERHETIYCEDVYITLTANEFIDNVKVQFIATMDNPQWTHEYWHKGNFEGTVTPGMSESIRFFRRTFRLPRIEVSRKGEGRDGYVMRQIRHEGDVILFDSTQAEVRCITYGIMMIKVYVHHRGGKVRGSMVIDTDRVHAPRSRLTPVDQVKVTIRNNYRRPLGAHMLYDEEPP